MVRSSVFAKLRLALLVLLASGSLSVFANPKTDPNNTHTPPTPPTPKDDPPAQPPAKASNSAETAKTDNLEDFQPLEGTPAAKEKMDAEAKRVAALPENARKSADKSGKASKDSKAAVVVSAEPDLIAHQPGAPSLKKDESVSLLDEMQPDGPVNSKARKCYDALGGMRDNIETIRKDIAAGGKEITRLIHCSDELAKEISTVADLWAYDNGFRDRCATAKRASLVLNDELTSEPRNFSRVRWAFEDAVQQIYKLRLRAKVMADVEPKPIAKQLKDGSIVYEDAPEVVDPKAVRRQAMVRQGEQARASAQRAENIKTRRENSVQIDIDGNTK